MYGRLSTHARRLNLDARYVSHLPHSNVVRFSQQQLGCDQRLDVEIERNRLIASTKKWAGPMSIFRFTEDTRTVCRGVIEHSEELDAKTRDALLAMAIKNRNYVRATQPATEEAPRRKLWLKVQNGYTRSVRTTLESMCVCAVSAIVCGLWRRAI